MDVCTSHYLPVDLQNLVAVLRLLDPDLFEVKAGILLQVTPKD